MKNRTKNQGGVVLTAGEIDEETQTPIGTDEFPHHGTDDGQGGTDAQAAQDKRQGGRDFQVAQHLPAVGAHGAHQVAQVSGTLRNPTRVLTSTGKKTIRAQISTLEDSPGPNQMTSRGAMATTGMAWLATI